MIAVTKGFLPHLRERGRGLIVNAASSSALANYPFVSLYSASKSAVQGVSQSLFGELAPFGVEVKVNVKVVFPGLNAIKIFTKLTSAIGPGKRDLRAVFPQLR